MANTARTFTGLIVNGTLTHTQNLTTATYRIDLTINGDVTIASGGSIDVSQRGFKNGSGTGAAATGGFNGHGGGGHGGAGANGSSYAGGAAYGSLTQPTTLGSGGGQYDDGYAGGKGGGAVKLVMSGTMTVIGTVNANAGNYATNTFNPGGGAGGSIYFITNTLAGSGSITANGGNGYTSGGGSGGGGDELQFITQKRLIQELSVSLVGLVGQQDKAELR